MKWLWVVVIFISGCSPLGVEGHNSDYISTEVNYAPSEQKLFELINLYREGLGLTNLKSSVELTNLSLLHCEYMISVGEVSHTNFSNRVKYLKSLGFSNINEVVSFGFNTPEGILGGYVSSPLHKELLEDPDLTHLGLAIVSDPLGRNYNTIIFAKLN